MRKLWYLVIAVVLLILGFTYFSGSIIDDYTTTINAQRQKARAYLTTNVIETNNNLYPDSVSYFKINPNLKISCRLRRIPITDITLICKDGSKEVFNREWQVVLPIGKDSTTLTLFRAKDKTDINYFLPFKDLTNGETSYGAGRYLEIAPTAFDFDKMNVEIDFNYCFNPYCAYSSKYICPLPPPENRINAPIEAGESYKITKE